MSGSSVRNAKMKFVRQGQGLPKPFGVAQAVLNLECVSSNRRAPWVRDALPVQRVPE
jgi:hypothetical protein